MDITLTQTEMSLSSTYLLLRKRISFREDQSYRSVHRVVLFPYPKLLTV